MRTYRGSSKETEVRKIGWAGGNGIKYGFCPVRTRMDPGGDFTKRTNVVRVAVLKLWQICARLTGGGR